MRARPTRGWCVRWVGCLLGAMVLCTSPARAADPLLMFLIGWAKNIIESQIEENAKKQRAAVPAATVVPIVTAPVAPPAPGPVSESDLRGLVDEGFAYLTPAQRAELLAGVEKALSDPANSAYREEILSQFANVARQAGYTHRQLDRLSNDQKRHLARQFAVNFKALTPDQQQDLLQQLRQRALPLPSDLNEMMLTALATP